MSGLFPESFTGCPLRRPVFRRDAVRVDARSGASLPGVRRPGRSAGYGLHPGDTPAIGYAGRPVTTTAQGEGHDALVGLVDVQVVLQAGQRERNPRPSHERDDVDHDPDGDLTRPPRQANRHWPGVGGGGHFILRACRVGEGRQRRCPQHRRCREAAGCDQPEPAGRGRPTVFIMVNSVRYVQRRCSGRTWSSSLALLVRVRESGRGGEDAPTRRGTDDPTADGRGACRSHRFPRR